MEQSVFNDNSLQTTYINGLANCDLYPPPCGVFVDQVNYFNGNVYCPVDLEVYVNTTIEGTFFPNGGLRSDAFPTGTFSFLVEDNTGDTGMIGELRVYGGIDADQGVFTVNGATGETIISTALLKPNGGISVQDGVFTAAAADGTFYTASYANVEGDFYLGTSKSDDRHITRYADTSAQGGDTYILGQSASITGGDIILEPGVGQDSQIGSIILGRPANDNLYFGRPPVDFTGTIGGDTFIVGQSTDFGEGGDIYFASGDSTSNGNAGDIVLDVGNSPNGAAGNIILGNEQQPAYPLNVYRPALQNGGPGGSTYLSGQSTNDGKAGNLYLKAGGVVNGVAVGVGTPGNIIIFPGINNPGIQGDIILGRSTPVNLIVRRYPFIFNGAGGNTFFNALDSAVTNRGGDLYLQAGDGGNIGNGGNVYLQLGDLSTPNPITQNGQIFWGSETTPLTLTVTRANSIGSGASTNILGQQSQSGNGGALKIIAGQGSTNGGNLDLTAGSGSLSDGGSVTFTGADGTLGGGSISFTAGSSNVSPGSVAINAGLGSGAGVGLGNSYGGSIYLNSGSGNGLGNVIIENANQLYVETATVVLLDYLLLQHGQNDDQLIFSANPESILSFNGQTLIKDRIFSVQTVDPTPITAPNPQPGYFDLPIVQRVEDLQDTVQNLISAFSQCGHGLFTTVDAAGNPAYCILPGPVPTPITRP